MSDDGFVRAFRAAWKDPSFRDLLDVGIWNYLYQNAAWRDGPVYFSGMTIFLKRGEIFVTPRYLARGFKTTDHNIRQFLGSQTERKRISLRTTNKGTIITICNYEELQQSRKTKQQTNHEQLTIDLTQIIDKDSLKEEERINNNTHKPKIPKVQVVAKPDDVIDAVWSDFQILRKTKRAPITQTALTGIRDEATKAGITLNDAMAEMIARGWQGFKAEWMDRNGNTANTAQNPHSPTGAINGQKRSQAAIAHDITEQIIARRTAEASAAATHPGQRPGPERIEPPAGPDLRIPEKIR